MISEDSPEPDKTADETQESGQVEGSSTVADRIKARLSKAENRYCEALVRVVCNEKDDISNGFIRFPLV